jgi:hypothetical protein
MCLIYLLRQVRWVRRVICFFEPDAVDAGHLERPAKVRQRFLGGMGGMTQAQLLARSI